MGFRACLATNFLPAYVKDEKLYCDFLLEHPIQLPKGTPDFPEQVNQVSHNNIACYLVNGAMELAIRFTKSGCLVQDKYLRNSFLIDWPIDKAYSYNPVGYFEYIDGSIFVAQHVNIRHGLDIITIPQLPITVVMTDYENSIMAECNRKRFKPTLYLQPGNTLGYKDFRKTLEGQQFGSRGFRTLGGYNIGKV